MLLMIFPRCILFSPACTSVGRCCPMPTAYTIVGSRPCMFRGQPRPTVGCWRLGFGSREKLQVDFLWHQGSVLLDQGSALLLGGLQLSVEEAKGHSVQVSWMSPLPSELGIFRSFGDPKPGAPWGFSMFQPQSHRKPRNGLRTYKS